MTTFKIWLDSLIIFTLLLENDWSRRVKSVYWKDHHHGKVMSWESVGSNDILDSDFSVKLAIPNTKSIMSPLTKLIGFLQLALQVLKIVLERPGCRKSLLENSKISNKVLKPLALNSGWQFWILKNTSFTKNFQNGPQKNLSTAARIKENWWSQIKTYQIPVFIVKQLN